MKLNWKLLLLAISPIPINAFYMATGGSSFADAMRYWDPLFFLAYIYWAGSYCRGRELPLVPSALLVNAPGLLCLLAGWVQLLAGFSLPIQLGDLYVSIVTAYAEVPVELLPGLGGGAALVLTQLIAALLTVAAFVVGYIRPPKPRNQNQNQTPPRL